MPRPRGKLWHNPATPLQAARFERQWTQEVVAEKVRRQCPGHNGRDCRLPATSVSEWETNTRPPTLPHIQALCRVYRMSAEDLGLISWRTPEEQALQVPAWLREQIRKEVRAELRREIAAEIVTAVTRCLRSLTNADGPTI